MANNERNFLLFFFLQLFSKLSQDLHYAFKRIALCSFSVASPKIEIK